jgi:hypothetical protein
VGRRRGWDLTARAQAARLDRTERWWLVLYGPAVREFCAFAGWPAAQRVVVRAASVEELEVLMRTAEVVIPRLRLGDGRG